MGFFQNPWIIQSIYDFQYFNCPTCDFFDRSKQEFINHVYYCHSDAIEYLDSIIDDSLEDVIVPWESKIQIHQRMTKIVKNNINQSEQQPKNSEFLNKATKPNLEENVEIGRASCRERV